MAGKFYKRNLAEACEEYSKIFGANKNLYRIMPRMADGLKPVQGRFLYALYKGKGRNNMIKMAKAAANTLDYHPHGDASITDVGAKMANLQCNNITTVKGQGNFGSYKDAEAGAARYIEVMLSDYAKKCFFEDFETSNVDMKLAYTGDDYEPEYLPARYPHALFNPQLSGIGYAFASNIPPFNVTEVMKAVIKLVKNPDANLLLIPDSPTGADIVDDGQFVAINETGVGTFTLRGSIEVDEMHNTLTITSIPLQVTIDEIIVNIVRLREKGIFNEIKDIKDYTNNKLGVKTIIYLDPAANPYKTIEKLYKKKTGLKKTYPVGLKMIDDYQDYDYSVRSFLLAWLDFRRDSLRSNYNYKLVKAMEDQNINDAMILVTTGKNSVKTIDMISKAHNAKEVAENLVKMFDINSQQATTMSNMKAIAFTKDAHASYLQKQEELKKLIKEYEHILDDEEEIDKIIIQQHEEGIKLFGSKRKSKIVADDSTTEPDDSEHIIGISRDGYIKKIPIENRQIGQVGQVHSQYATILGSNRDNIIIFTSTGKAYKIAINDIPDMQLDDVGILLERYYKVEGRVIDALIEPDEKELKRKEKDLFLVFLTKLGFVKKTYVSDFSHANGGTTAIKLPANDELVSVLYAYDDTVKDVVIYTNLGKGIRRDINEFSIMKPQARGVKQLTLSEGESCIGFDKISPDKNYIFYLTSAGRVKVTELKYFPTMKRKDDVLTIINLEGKETLVGLHSVNATDTVYVYRKHGAPDELKISDIGVSTRASKAVKALKHANNNPILYFGLRE